MPVASSRAKLGMTPPAPFSVHSSWRLRLALLCTRQVIGRALLAAILVGSLLVSVHQGDAIFTGQITGRVVLKVLLTPLSPFCVTLWALFSTAILPQVPKRCGRVGGP
jgi:hypothetical protein